MASSVLGVRDDLRDALIQSALAPPEAALTAWRRIAATAQHSADPIVRRWLPLVALNISHVAGESSGVLRNVARQTWASNASAFEEVDPVLQQFAASGIECVLLKGASLLLTAYPHAGARPVGDIDVLVRRDQLPRACALLERGRWRPHRPCAGLPLRVRHAFDFRSPSGAALDVHQALLAECSWPDADAEVWDRVESVSGSRPYRVLNPADQLLQVCVHGLRWSPIHAATWLADAVNILRSAGARLSWDVLVEEVRQRQLQYQMMAALTLVEKLGRVDIPPQVRTALGTRSIVQRLECRAKTRPVLGPAGLTAFWCGWHRLRRHTPSLSFRQHLAGTVGLDSEGQLPHWLWGHLRRRWAFGLRDPWGRGVSQSTVLADDSRPPQHGR